MSIARTLALGAMLLPAAGFAGDASVGKLEIRGAFSRASNPGAVVAGAFMTITNTGAEADQLVGAASPIAAMGGTHTHVRNGDILDMVPVGAIDIPAGHTVTLQPGGLHVMFDGLRQPLKEGDKFPVTLKFVKAGSTTVTVDVGANRAMTPPGQGPAAMGPGMGHGPGGTPMGGAGMGQGGGGRMPMGGPGMGGQMPGR